jgi:hypothetical protein
MQFQTFKVRNYNFGQKKGCAYPPPEISGHCFSSQEIIYSEKVSVTVSTIAVSIISMGSNVPT